VAREVEVSLARSHALSGPTMILGANFGELPSGLSLRVEDSRVARTPTPATRIVAGWDSKTDLLDAGGEDRSSCDSPG
jgi:hypothetical protein